jgi:hypothetical protein
MLGFDAVASFGDRVYCRIGIGCNNSPQVGAVGAKEENARDETLPAAWH